MKTIKTSYIYQSPEDWGETTYAASRQMRALITRLQRENTDDDSWQSITFSDCGEWCRVSGNLYRHAKNGEQKRFVRTTERGFYTEARP